MYGESIMKFEVGKTYFCTSICDQNCKWEYTITKRTTSSVWLGEKRAKINITDNSEYVFPQGRYSMAPVLRAERMVK
jgi:hypothetical protein